MAPLTKYNIAFWVSFGLLLIDMAGMLATKGSTSAIFVLCILLNLFSLITNYALAKRFENEKKPRNL